MNVAFFCVLLAGLMPFLWTAVAKVAAGRYDNRDPRGWQAKLEGMPKRAHAAHLNSFEAFPLFAAGVLAALFVGVPQGRVDALAIAFVVLRLAYGGTYLADIHLLRSALWFGGIGCSFALLFQAAFSAT